MHSYVNMSSMRYFCGKERGDKGNEWMNVMRLFTYKQAEKQRNRKNKLSPKLNIRAKIQNGAPTLITLETIILRMKLLTPLLYSGIGIL